MNDKLKRVLAKNALAAVDAIVENETKLTEAIENAGKPDNLRRSVDNYVPGNTDLLELVCGVRSPTNGLHQSCTRFNGVLLFPGSMQGIGARLSISDTSLHSQYCWSITGTHELLSDTVITVRQNGLSEFHHTEFARVPIDAPETRDSRSSLSQLLTRPH